MEKEEIEEMEEGGEIKLVKESSQIALEKHKTKVGAHVKALEALLGLHLSGCKPLVLKAAKEGLHLLETGEMIGGTYFVTTGYERRGRHEWEPAGDYFREVKVRHFISGTRVRLVPEEITGKAKELLYGGGGPKEITESALELMKTYIK